MSEQSNRPGSILPAWLLRRGGPVVFVLGLGIALSLTLFIGARHREWSRIRADLDRAGEGRVAALQRHLDEHLLELETIAAFYAGSQEVTREEFRRFVSPFLAEDRDILAVEWIPRVPTGQRAAFEEAARRGGLTGFEIAERNDRGETVPAAQREEYFPVTYAEPTKGNERALGFDFSSDPIRLEALARARDAGEAAATAPVEPIQGEPGQPVLSILIPIYRNEAPTGTVEERRANLFGFALIVHSLNRFIENATAPLDAAEVDTYLFDVSAPERERFLYAESANNPSVQASASLDEASVRAGPHYATSLDVAGRTWRLVCTPTEEFIGARRTAQPWMVLAGGLLLASALLAYLLMIFNYAARTHRFGQQQADARRALEREVHERTLAEEALRESEERFSKAFHASPNLMGITSLDEGRVIDINAAYCRLTGYERDELIGRTTAELNVWADPEQRNVLMRTLREEGRVRDLEIKLRTRSGEIRTLIFSGETLALGNDSYLLSVAMDITERKEAEEALRESEQEKAAVLDSMSELVAYQDADMRVLWANRVAAQSVGITPERLVGRHCYEIWPKRSEPCIGCPVTRARETGQPCQEEMTTPDGRVWLVRAYPVKNPEGRVENVVEVTQDITARKAAERALRDSEEKYRLVSENIPVAVYAALPDEYSTNLFVTGQIEELTGYTAAEFVKDPELWVRIVHPDDQARVWERVLEHRRNKTPLDAEYRIITKDQVEKWILDRATPVLDENGEIAQITGFMEDITERKRAEEALRESESKNRTLLENLPQKAFLKDRDSVYVTCNENYARDLGVKAAEIVGRTDHEFFPKELAEKYRADDKRILESGKTEEIDERYIQEGQERIVHTVKAPVKDAEGKVVGLLGIFWDVTEHKRAEEALRQSEQRLQAVLAALPVGVIIVDPETRVIVDANPMALGMIGAGREAVVNRPCSDYICRAENGRCPITDLGQTVDNAERQLLTAKGSAIPVFKTVTRTTLGGREHLLETFVDITERKRAEEALRAAKERAEHALTEVETQRAVIEQNANELAQALDEAALQRQIAEDANRLMSNILSSASSLVIAVDDASRVTQWNPAAERLFGIPAWQALGKPFAECDVPWDNTEAVEGMAACRYANKPVRLEEVRFTRLDKTTGLLSLMICPMADEQGTHVGAVLLGEDVTERWAMEDKLRRAQKLESVGALAAGIAHEINTPIQFVSDNTRFLAESFAQLQYVLDAYNTLKTFVESGGTAAEVLGCVGQVEQQADVAYLRREIPRAIEQTLEGVERVTKIVGAIKNFSHLDQGKKTPADLNRALEGTLTMASNELKYVADVVTDLDPNLPLVPCYLSDLNQVFLNLLVNAAHAVGDAVATGEDAKGTITVSTRQEGREVVIRVADTGTGIPEDIRNRIFEPFFTTKTVGKGTGQGLAIAHHLVVDKHGGTLSFQTEAGKGTAFIIRLPIEEQPAQTPAGSAT
jgi:PAS domain S-box-containing protein